MVPKRPSVTSTSSSKHHIWGLVAVLIVIFAVAIVLLYSTLQGKNIAGQAGGTAGLILTPSDPQVPATHLEIGSDAVVVARFMLACTQTTRCDVNKITLKDVGSSSGNDVSQIDLAVGGLHLPVTLVNGIGQVSVGTSMQMGTQATVEIRVTVKDTATSGNTIQLGIIQIDSTTAAVSGVPSFGNIMTITSPSIINLGLSNLNPSSITIKAGEIRPALIADLTCRTTRCGLADLNVLLESSVPGQSVSDLTLDFMDAVKFSGVALENGRFHFPDVADLGVELQDGERTNLRFIIHTPLTAVPGSTFQVGVKNITITTSTGTEVVPTSLNGNIITIAGCTATGAETCDGIDNNCDGQQDENNVCNTRESCGIFGRACVATQTCQAGVCVDAPPLSVTITEQQTVGIPAFLELLLSQEREALIFWGDSSRDLVKAAAGTTVFNHTYLVIGTYAGLVRACADVETDTDCIETKFTVIVHEKTAGLLGDADGNGCVSAIEYNDFKINYLESGSSEITAVEYNDFKIDYLEGNIPVCGDE